MGEKCIVCGKTMRQGIKTEDGFLCRDCVPASLPAKAMSTRALISVAEYEHWLKSRPHEVTASYGKLMIDELHGYVMLADKTGKDGEPVSPYEIYDLTNIEEIGLYPTSPRAERNGVFCDVEFSISLLDPPIAVKKTVKTGARCSYKPVGQQLEWTEPGDLTMFRNMVNQCIETATTRETKKLSRIDRFQAESALFLRDGYTEEEVLDHAERLLKAFTGMPDGDEDYAAAIRFYCKTVERTLS